jgi:hypothetical protein
VVHDRLLLAERLEVDPHIVEKMNDRVGLGLHLVDHFAARVDDEDPLVGLGDS